MLSLQQHSYDKCVRMDTYYVCLFFVVVAMAHNYSSAILGLCECLVCAGAIGTTVSYVLYLLQ